VLARHPDHHGRFATSWTGGLGGGGRPGYSGRVW
jgi:hypothetical protein